MANKERVKAKLSIGADFETLTDVRRELSRLYWAAKQAHMDVKRANALAYLLNIISGTLRNEVAVDIEKLRAEVEAVKDRLQGGQTHDE